MMNFPTPTFIGQQWSNGITLYAWDGVGWNIAPQMMPVYISDTPPANPAVGQEWWRSTNGQLYVWYDDGNSKQWVQSAGAALGSLVETGFWTPTFTFATPGNVSVSYSNRLGIWRRTGNFVTLDFAVSCTPTFTTASGILQLTGVPFTPTSDAAYPTEYQGACCCSNFNPGANYGGYTSRILPGDLSVSFLASPAIGGGRLAIASAHVATATATVIAGNVTFPIAA
jgi:hypothetical protein